MILQINLYRFYSYEKRSEVPCIVEKNYLYRLKDNGDIQSFYNKTAYELSCIHKKT